MEGIIITDTTVHVSTNPDVRGPAESYADFKARRKRNKQRMAAYLSGRLVWPGVNGTIRCVAVDEETGMKTYQRARPSPFST